MKFLSQRRKPACSVVLMPAVRALLVACAFLFTVTDAKADYTVASGTNINASTLTGQSGVLTINGILTVSSNVNLAGFTSVIINSPSGEIYWSNNSDLTFTAGTTISIKSGAPGLQSHGSNASQRLILGSVIIAVSNDNSNAAAFSFTQINSLGGLPQYGSSFSTPSCSGSPFTATVSALKAVTGVAYTYSWSISPSSGTFSYNSDQTTATITPDAGSYTVTCVASANTYKTTFSFTINIPQSYVWKGATSHWSDASDWCPGVPVSTSSVIIPSGVSTPTIESGTTARVNNLTIQSGATLIVDGTLQVKGTITNNGTLDVTNGTLEMNGSAAQSISGSMFYSKTIDNLIVSNTAGLSVSSTANDTLKISGSLTYGNSSASLNTGNNIELLSSENKTAYVGKIASTNSITGNLIADRYVNIGTDNGQHAKSWQFIAAPTTGESIRESWMENGNQTAGHGVWLTGPGGTASGFDATSPGVSIKTYNPLTNTWDAVSNVNTGLAEGTGYMVFIRGDRTVNGVTSTTAKSTTLRSKGTLATGNVGPISVLPDHYAAIGNPYASSIDFSLVTRSNGVDNLFYIWDPYMYGVNGYGGYETMSASNGWVPVPGGTTAYPTGVANSTIQSGQAFFVHATTDPGLNPQNPSVTLTESCKVDGSSTTNFARTAPKLADVSREYLRANLYIGTSPGAFVADGNAVVFDSSFSNKVDANDALKIMNSGENFGVSEAGKILSIEAGSPADVNDTIHYLFNNLKRQAYQIRFLPQNMQDNNLQPYLVDNFLHNSTAIKLTDTTAVNFSVTADAASYASNRFYLVFRQLSTLSSINVSINAAYFDDQVLVQWQVDNPGPIVQYTLEKSGDGTTFSDAYSTSDSKYQWTDSNPVPGDNYYRLKMTDANGNITYSAVKMVSIDQLPESITVSPNPVVNNQIKVIYRNTPAGSYQLHLVSSFGQEVFSKTFIHLSHAASDIVPLDGISKGIYQLVIVNPTGVSRTIKVVY